MAHNANWEMKVCQNCGQTFSRKSRNTDTPRSGQACSRSCSAVVRTTPLASRFLAMVTKSGSPEECWGWRGFRDKDGYSRLMVRTGQQERASRVSWALHFGPIPDGLFVCHRCDNPACSNPQHLFLGTPLDNSRDMVAKGRVRFGDSNSSRTHPELLKRGEQTPTAKLNERQVIEIRQLLSECSSVVTIARRFQVSEAAVRKIRDRKSWAHIA